MSLVLDQLAIRHDGAPVLRDVSLRIEPGRSLCLVGASGGGKSLVAQAVAGLLPECMAAAGSIGLGRWTHLAADQAGLRRRWGESCVLPQEPGQALSASLRAMDQVGLAPPRLGRAAATDWLARFGIDAAAARQRPAALSGGMAQRLLVALLARTAAPLLVLDEPTTGLDDERRDALIAVLIGLRAAGRTLLVITHDLAVARALDDDLAVLEDGRIVEHGPAAALLAAPGSAFLRACVAADPALWPTRPRLAGAWDVAQAEQLVIGHAGPVAGPLDLVLGAGRMLAILGPSGSGKTTLGDTVLGLSRPRAGRLSWFGRALDAGHIRRLRPRFQKMHQDPTAVFPPGRTLRDCMADLRHLADGAAIRSRVPGLLDQLHVNPSLLGRTIDAVSGGEAQRVALARVLAMRPACLVADEPGSRLDPPVQMEALTLLRGLADSEGLAIMLITHDHQVAAALADAELKLAPARAS